MRRIVGILFVLVAALPYVAMLRRGGQPAAPSTAGPTETLTIISPHRREVKLEYSRGFAEYMRREHHRHVELRWIDVGGTSKILKDLESRYTARADDPGVDVFFGGGVAPFYQAMQRGWLTPTAVPADMLAGIPERCAGSPVYDRGSNWFGVALSGFGILYNRPLIERMHLPVPAAWEDLGRPEFLSWVGSGDPRSSGSVQMCYEIILQAYGFERGWNLITRISANVRSFGESGSTVPREVAAGDAAAGMVIDQYAQTVVDAVGGNLLVFVLPAQMTVINADPIAALKGGRAELAALFVRYTLSAEGQRLLCQPVGANGQVSALYRLPVRESLYHEASGPGANPYAQSGGMTFDENLANVRRDVLNDLMGVCLIDMHDELARAWGAIVRAGCPAALVADLGRPPVSGAELAALAPQWKDPRRRMDATRQWAHDAQARYRRLQDQAGAGSAAVPAPAVPAQLAWKEVP